MSEVKIVIFDMDGLLLDTERCLWMVNEMKVVKSLGYEPSEEFCKKLMGSSWDTYEVRIKALYGQEFPFQKYYDLLMEENKKMIENGSIPLMKGAKELLDFLKQNNIKMAIGTSTHKEQAISCLKNSGIYDYFDEIVCGDDVTKGKPDPETYLKPCLDFNIDPSNALVFEDGHNGSLAAFAAGIRLMLVPDLAILTQDDLDNAYAVLDDLSQAIDIIKKDNNI